VTDVGGSLTSTHATIPEESLGNGQAVNDKIIKKLLGHGVFYAVRADFYAVGPEAI
jgi:hypothetical protein